MTTSNSDYLPLTEATFLILLSLAPSAKHGYAILKTVQELSDGRVRLSTGTLYGALDRLLDLGWIERIDEGDKEGERGRKSYQLSDLGRRVLQAEMNRMVALVTLARREMSAE